MKQSEIDRINNIEEAIFKIQNEIDQLKLHQTPEHPPKNVRGRPMYSFYTDNARVEKNDA
jgi:hypothetical protein